MIAISLNPIHALFAAGGYKTVLDSILDTGHRGWVALYADQTKLRPVDLDVWPISDCLLHINRWRFGTKGWPPLWDMGRTWEEERDPNYRQTILDGIPRGAVVGVAWLAKVERLDGITERWNRLDKCWRLVEPDYADVTSWEPTFGDYTSGRGLYAGWLAFPIALRDPIVIAGGGYPDFWDTATAWARDNAPQLRQDAPESTITRQGDGYESAVFEGLRSQMRPFYDEFDPAFFRQISRRGETHVTRPRSM